MGPIIEQPGPGLVRLQERPARPVRELRPARARSARPGRGRAQPPQQSNARPVMATGYHVSRRINAPADRVWEILTDTAKYRDWNRAVVSIEGTMGRGNTISLVSIVNP